ncbi:MAG: tRNA epoxyqueuosine(34) reductase QueG, partial [Chitinophagales bacterium]
GEMSYMERNFDLRTNPQLLHQGTKSIISFSYNYFTEMDPKDQKKIKISKYAQGRDYHKVVKNKLKQVIQWLQIEIGDINARAFVDSAPVMEREWAKRSGIGWVGKNSLLLTKSKGSFFFLGEIFLDVELEYDSPVKNYCGSCTKCLDACPTKAIIEPYVVDSNKCISYLTIEYKKADLPDFYQQQNQGWAYGCDICQDVCPINSRATQHETPDFTSPFEIHKFDASKWVNLTESEFHKIFHDSAVKRAGYQGLMRNIKAITKK